MRNVRSRSSKKPNDIGGREVTAVFIICPLSSVLTRCLWALYAEWFFGAVRVAHKPQNWGIQQRLSELGHLGRHRHRITDHIARADGLQADTVGVAAPSAAP